MKNGYVRIAAVPNRVVVGNPTKNAQSIIEKIAKLKAQKVDIAVFPELCLTGYTCNDLFFQRELLEDTLDALCDIKNFVGNSMLVAVGMPLAVKNKLYNVMAFIEDGDVIGFVPKTNIPNYGEFYEKRYFEEGPEAVSEIVWYNADGIVCEQLKAPFGRNLLFQDRSNPDILVAGEICEDLWVPCPPSITHAMNGATIILNSSASNETVGKADYRRDLVNGQSARLICAYAYASAGIGESTQDLVFSGHNLISENGKVLGETNLFKDDMIIQDVDVEKIMSERRRKMTYKNEFYNGYHLVNYLGNNEKSDGKLLRKIPKMPFVPENEVARKTRCNEIFMMQAEGLRKRMEHIGCQKTVIGVSGGLDSTLALLVAIKAYEKLGMANEGIIGISMPCFGTSDRTKGNAWKLMEALKVTAREVPIGKSVTQHLEDIGHNIEVHDITYENAQARERTQVLMDVANEENGLVIGTGDMSELALGWCTYNGDHMSMYAVNAGIPKTLVKYLVKYYADETENARLRSVLYDILDTPVSPELLPPDKNGEIVQVTEDKIGPYELHDFFLYQALRFGFKPRKIFDMAVVAFEGYYGKETILKWLQVFYRRFFSQQFKRSCLPDGPKIGSVALSPRGDLRMPSDADAFIWIEDLKKINLK